VSELRRWMLARRAGAERERAERRANLLSPRESFALGLELIDFAAELVGWPIPEDAVTRQQDQDTRETWRRLRRRLARR
jgi:hypothetical protein